ncbi:hypothetical protein MAPG_01650 [Magnaporthiopsis poae ATCC 64411]|uniref:SH3 domain-containing protein n=1 Tax=Magnaporthiopsis poae (strain ATCC 64411 / 73-15) TaxID=644358 RepID=A0A0C4DP93_MAGP6|nr:hypothetical protein MAPG_01650 [Magnaporthiopsis poae ATCC 64411]
MATNFKVKALFEYSSPHEDDLQFAAGQIITVTEEEDDDWYTGEYVDDAGAKHEGIFPRNFVENGLSGSSGFIKKPFVAPPPSRNAYVPPPREAPTTKVYRRDEDPEIKEREQENLQSAEKAGLVAGSSQSAEGDDEPKPLSLKERMALLQKQQQEQAQRHADAAAKREKPKRPAKKRVESNDGADEGESSLFALPPLERQESGETAGRPSVDEPPVGRANRRKSSTRGLGEPNDGNEADLSGAGDTTEGQEDLTEREDSDDKPSLPIRVAGPATEAPGVEGAEEEEEEEEDEDVDPEVRRKEELRARMAKMSGGMGMAGMFGMPMPSPSVPAKKKKAPPAPAERRSSEAPDAAPSPPFQPPPVPAMMMALPGLSAKRPEESAPTPEEQTEAPGAENNDDGDGSAPMQAAPPAIGMLARVPTGSAPPVPSGRPAPPPVPSEGISLGLCGSSTRPGRRLRGED